MRVMGIDPGATHGAALIELPEGRGQADYIEHASTRDLDELLRLLTAWEPELVGCESVTTVYSRARFGAGMATALLNAERAVGDLRNECRKLAVPFVSVRAAAWRKLLTGNGSVGDQYIKSAVMLWVRGWPKRSNAHARDAAGVAFWAGVDMKGRKAVEARRRAG